MTAASIGHLLARRYNPDGTRKRGDSKVRRQSFDVDDKRAHPFRRIGDGSIADGCRWRDSFMRAVEEWNIQYRVQGKGVPLPGGYIRVLRALLYSNQLEFRTGELAPALNLIAKIAGCAKDTVVRALAKFRDVGILDWVRRSRKTGNPPGMGLPAREQETNAYFFPIERLPQRLRARFEQLLEWQRRKAANRRQVVERPLSVEEQVAQRAEEMRSLSRDHPKRLLQEQLDRLGKALDGDSCESDSRGVCPPER